MKKGFLWVVILVCAVFLLASVRESYFEKVPDYKIHQSFITGADDYKNVNLKVIVNLREYDMNEMFEMIRNDYVDLNGEPDVLCIDLFDDQQAFENAENSGSKKFER